MSSTVAGCSSYGLAIDRDDRLWLAGYGLSGLVSCFYEHDRPDNKWSRCAWTSTEADGFSSGRGIVSDAHGHVYMSSNSGGRLTRFRWNEEQNTCEFVPMLDSTGTRRNSVPLGIGGSFLGVGFDPLGNPWTISSGNQAARLNLSDGSITRTQRANGNVGNAASYYTYSDFTGHQLKLTLPNGIYTRVIEGCARYSSWKSVGWEAEIPPNTRIDVYVRVSNTNTHAEWLGAHRHGPLPISWDASTQAYSANLSEVPQGTFLRLEFELYSEDRETTPLLRSYELAWNCAPPLT